MTTYVATITHDDDGDLNVMIEGAGSSPDDRASSPDDRASIA